MLQQTRVETVVPYYRKFLRRFPSIEVLAAADLEEVLTEWSGLGYYRRARFLHRAACQVIEEGGSFPSTIEDLRRLPGIGEYTAAAIGSIAFGIAEPVLDGNVERILARRVGESGDVKRAAVRREQRSLARALLDPERPGDSNQAMMELGATVCTPRDPRCERCPWSGRCVAEASGHPESFPTPRARRPRERVERTAFRVENREGGVLLFKRPEESTLLAGIWEFPSLPGHVDDPRRAERSLGEKFGGSWSVGDERGRVRHGITFRDLEISVRTAELVVGDEVSEGHLEAAWLDRARLDAVPLSSLVRKILAASQS